MGSGVPDQLQALGIHRGKPLNPGALEILSAHGAKHGSKKVEDPRELQDRVLLRMVNEAVQCLEDGILDNPQDGDIGAVFGIGFPPNLGGPFRYIDQLGAASVVAAMRELEASVGPQYTPPRMLVEMADAGGRFHGGK
jgi:3-hydroxyacyl-CoA dehydrogenase